MQTKNIKILIVTYHYLNDVGGGVFASRAYINAFAELYSDITLICPSKNNDNIDNYEINKKIKIIPVLNNYSKLKKFYNFLTGKPHCFSQVFKSVTENNHYNIVIFDNSKASAQLIDLANKLHSKVITIHHNYEYDYTRDNSKTLFKPIALFWSKRIEKAAVNNSSLNLTLTQYDKTIFESQYGCNNIIVSGCFEYKKHNGLNSSYRVGTTASTIKSEPKFIITGNLSAKQTIKSLHIWIKEYFHIIKEVIPSASLTIAGKNPDKNLIKICKRNNIEIIASPKSMDSILHNAQCYICPISKGGGIKLRVMDGLRNGIPVICDKVSERGYETITQLGYILTYYNKQTFREALTKFSTKPYNYNNIKAAYIKYFSYDSGVSRLRGIISNNLKFNDYEK